MCTEDESLSAQSPSVGSESIGRPRINIERFVQLLILHVGKGSHAIQTIPSPPTSQKNLGFLLYQREFLTKNRGK
jgi:hypothetical protein